MRHKQIRPHADSTLVARAIGDLLNEMPPDVMDAILARALLAAHGLTLAEVRQWRMTHAPIMDEEDELDETAILL